MDAITERITRALTQTASIVSDATGGIYDRDLRRTGSGATPFAFDADGDIKPTVMVDDAGDVREPFSHRTAVQGTVYVWVFAGRSVKGEEQVEDLVRKIRGTLLAWRDTDPTYGAGAELVPIARTGLLSDEQAIWDRLTFSYAAFLPNANI
jgi:hypothetical protein